MAKQKTDKETTQQTKDSQVESTELMTDNEPQVRIEGTLTAMSRPRYRGCQVFSSIDPETPEGKKMIFNAISGKSVPLREMEGKTISFVGYIAQRGMIEGGEEREPRLGVKLLMLDADGTRYFSTAASVLAAVDRVMEFYGPGPYDPPIDLKVEKTLTANGRPWYTLELV